MQPPALAEAVAAWGGSAVQPRLVAARENRVYEVWLPGGVHAALRLHRPGYQTAASIRSELVWVRDLAAAGVAVPVPVPMRGGGLVHTGSDGGLCSMLEWVPGVPLGTADAPLDGTRAGQTALFWRVGRAVAQMHEASDRIALQADFERQRWDAAGLLGSAPLWGRFWENAALRPDERRLVLQARDKARQELAQFAARGGDFGLIHADVLRENLLVDGDRVTLIDFDDAGWGFRMFDLGTLMIQNRREPAYDDLVTAVVAGYRSARPLPDDAVALLPLFVLLRAFASMGWVMPRLAADDPRIRTYVARAVEHSAAFVR